MTRPLRVLRVITRLNVGGPATHVTVVDRGLAARGWQTLLAFGTVEPDELEIDVSSLDLPMVRIPSMARPVRPLADLRAAAAIARLIRRHRPDVIHSHLSKAGLLARSVAMTTSRAVRVHTFHGTVFGGYFGTTTSAAIVAVERFLSHRTHAVVALSERQRQELLDNHVAEASRISIVPLGLPIEWFVGSRTAEARLAARRRLGVPEDAYAIAAVGRLVPIKRLDRLIAAFASMAAAVPTARLYLVGDGAERGRLEQLARASGFGDRIQFAGWSTATTDWYAAADVVTLTSDREGTPLALIEAAAAGRPVVAANVGGTADIVLEGRTGFVVEPDDIPGYASHLTRLAADPALRAALGEEAIARSSRYASERLVDDLDRLYRRTLDTFRAGRTR